MLLWGEWGAAAAARSSIRAFLLKPSSGDCVPCVLPLGSSTGTTKLHGGGGHLARLAGGAGWGACSILCADSVVDAGRVARNDLCLEVYESGPAAARCTGGRANTALAPRCVGARPGDIQATLQQPEIPSDRRAGVGRLAGRARVRRRRPTRRWRRRSGATPVTTEPSRARRGPVERARQASAGREPGRECDMVVQRGLGASPAAPGCWPPTSTCSSRGDRATVFEHTAGRKWQAGQTEAHIRGMKGQARACSFGVSGGRHAVRSSIREFLLEHRWAGQLFFLAPWALFHGAHAAFTAESTKRSTSRTAPGAPCAHLVRICSQTMPLLGVCTCGCAGGHGQKSWQKRQCAPRRSSARKPTGWLPTFGGNDAWAVKHENAKARALEFDCVFVDAAFVDLPATPRSWPAEY